MRHLVNRTAIHVLLQNHRIRDKMLNACTSRGAMCTAKQGRTVQMQNFIFGRFSNFFFLSKWDLDPPTHFQIIFGIFLTLQSPLANPPEFFFFLSTVSVHYANSFIFYILCLRQKCCEDIMIICFLREIAADCIGHVQQMDNEELYNLKTVIE